MQFCLIFIFEDLWAINLLAITRRYSRAWNTVHSKDFFFSNSTENFYLMLTQLFTHTPLQPPLNRTVNKAHSPYNCMENNEAHEKNVFKGVMRTVPFAHHKSRWKAGQQHRKNPLTWFKVFLLTGILPLIHAKKCFCAMLKNRSWISFE